MEFNPINHIIQLCLQGLDLEEKGKHAEAGKIFIEAWNESTNDFEKFISAHFVAKYQKEVSDQLKWFETALQLAIKINSEIVMSAFHTLYLNIAKCYEELNDPGNAKKYHDLANSFAGKIFDKGPFYHGTKANLKTGDLLTAGFVSNYREEVIMNHIYFTAQVNGAGLAAALSKGIGRERVYIVEPTGSIENDPNVTDKKFPGNMTRSYRTKEPLKIVGEVNDWARLTPGDIQKWREKLSNSKGDIIN